MKPYPEYKDSGIEWISEIPKHWNITRLKYLCKSKLMYGANESADLEDHSQPRYIRITDFGDDGKLKDATFKSLPYEKAEPYLLEDGDVLFARSGATVGKTFQFKNYNGKACFAGYLIKASPNEDVMLSDFIYFYTKSRVYENWKNSIFIQATIQNIGADKYNDLLISLPSIREQQSIATHLHKKTSQIDSLIQKKQQMIELLKEERAAIINQAVTKGINPDAEMKDSGIEWLGEVPKHWNVKRLKFVCSEKLMYGANESAESEDPDQPRYIRITDFGDDGKLKDDTFKSLPKEKAEPYLLKEGDILFARSGATVGKTFQFRNYIGRACFAGYLIKAKPNKNIIHSDFLYVITKSKIYENWKNQIFVQATIQNIGADKYNDFTFGLPPLIEQTQIVEFIEKRTSKIDLSINRIEKEISLIEEYRTALINEAVTGKIDIRE